jgi:uncharacterized protein
MSINFGISARLLEKIKGICFSVPTVDKTVIFGSRSLGTYREGSDLDICLIDRGMSFSDLLRIQTRIDELNLPIHCDIIRYSTLENTELKEHIARVGVEL